MKEKYIILFLVTISMLSGIYYVYYFNYDLIMYSGYMIISNSFISIPHEPLVLYYGKMYDIESTVIFAIVPTIFGCYLDYLVLDPILNGKISKHYKQTKFYNKIMDYFSIMPFTTILIIAATPIPFYPVRLLSISGLYSRHCYAAAVLIGRVPRYFLIALGAQYFQISVKSIVLFTIFIFVWYFGVIIFKKNNKLI